MIISHSDFMILVLLRRLKMNIQINKFEHVISVQAQAEQAMQKEWAAGNFTFANPYVKVNPYVYAPLTALVYFKTEKAQAVSIVVKGKEAAGDFTFDFPKASEHALPILGLYSGTTTEVVLTLEDGTTNTLKLTTEATPEKLIPVTKIETTAEYFGQNVMFVSPTSPAYLAAYDYKGDARWYCTLNTSFDLKRVENGRILVGTNRLVLAPYHTSGLYEMGMVGKFYKEYRIPGGYHHDQFEMEDGNLLVLTQKPARGTVEDVCVLIDRKTGMIIREWDYQTILPQNVGGSGSQDAHDWFHNNAVWYDKKTNSLTFSGRHQDVCMNINYDTGKLNWLIGDPEGWPEDMQKYFFKPVGDVANFDWQYEQHANVILPDGDVMCFDNGHYRAKVKEKYVPAKDNFSRGVRYKIYTDKMEIEQVWQYGKERGAEFFSTYICNVEYYAEGHYLVHSGGIGFKNGEALDKPPVSLQGEDGIGVEFRSITVELKDDKVMYEMQLPANFYRAEKIKLYHENDVLTFGKGELLGTMGITETFDTIPEVEDGGEIPSKYKIRLGQEEDRLVLNASFEKGQMVMLILEGKENYAYFIPTTKRPFLAMCVGTFLNDDERAIEHPISLEGIAKGDYKLKIIIDDKSYICGATLTV